MVSRNTEKWKPIEDFPGYEISNMGRVKSLKRSIDRSDDWPLNLKERILKSHLNKDGYPQLNLHQKKKPQKRMVHLLVLNHFGPPKPSPRHECNHKDGIKENNWSTNLEWMTPKQNSQHAWDIGLHGVKIKRGERIIKRNRSGGNTRLPKHNVGGFLPWPPDECIKSEFHRIYNGEIWIDLSICHSCELLVACHRRKAYMDHVRKYGVNAKPEGAGND